MSLLPSWTMARVEDLTIEYNSQQSRISFTELSKQAKHGCSLNIKRLWQGSFQVWIAGPFIHLISIKKFVCKTSHTFPIMFSSYKCKHFSISFPLFNFLCAGWYQFQLWQDWKGIRERGRLLNSRMTDKPTNQNAGKPFLHQVGRNFNINTPIHLTYM